MRTGHGTELFPLNQYSLSYGNRIEEETSPIRRAILQAAHSKAVCCPLPGKYLLMQAWPPLAGLIAHKKAAIPERTVHSMNRFLIV